MRILRQFAVIFGVLITGSLLGLTAFGVWLLGSNGGARWTLDMVQRLELADVQVEDIQGRLLGPLQLRGIRYRAEGIDLVLDQARLEWSPARLMRRQVQVDLLQLGTLELRLQATEPDPEEDDSGPFRVPQLPIAILVGRVQADAVRVWLPDAEAPQIVDDILGEGLAWHAERLQVLGLSARHALTGALQVAMDARLAPEFVELQQLTLAELRPEAQAGEGDDAQADVPLQLAAEGRVQLDDAPSDLRLNWQALRWPLQGDEPPLVVSASGRAHLQGTPQALDADADFEIGARGQVQAQARYTPQELFADLNWQRLQWPLLGAPSIVSDTGHFEVRGLPEDYRYQLDGELAAEGRQGTAEAAGAGSLSHVVLENLRLAVAKATVQGRARVDWNVGESAAVAVDADLDIRNLNPGLIAPEWPGRLNGTLKARSQIENEVPRAQFEVALRDSELRGYPLRLDAKGASEATTVVLDSLHLRTGGTHLRAQGQVTPPFDFSASLDSPDLAALWPGLGGRAELQAQVRGELDAPQVVASGQVRELIYDTVQLERVDLGADVALAGAWKLDLDVRGLSGPTDMRQAQLQLRGRDREHLLTLNVDAEPAQAELVLRGAFDRQALRWQGELASGRVAPQGLAEWNLEAPAALRLDAQTVNLEPACWAAPDSRACARVVRDPQRLRAGFRLEQLDFAYFAPFLPPGWGLAGGVDGFGLVEVRDGALAEVQTRLSTDPIEVRRDGQVVLQAEPGRLRVTEENGLAVAELYLPIDSGELNLQARLGSEGAAAVPMDQRPLTARLDLRFDDLGFLRLTTEEVEHMEGRILGHLQWSGSLAALQSSGEIRLIDGEVHLATPGIEVEDIALQVAAQGQDLQLQASARSGEGSLQLDGSARLAAGKPQMKLAIRGENFQAADITMAQAWISPDLTIELEGRRLDVRGEVRVPRADITPPTFEGGVAPSADQIIVTGEEDRDAPVATADAGLQIHADVTLRLGDAVAFDGYGLKTRLTGSVRAVETPGRAGSGRGEIRLVGGRYKAYGQDLDIQTGRLLFTGSLTEPAVEIRAVRKPREDIEVGVLVRGTLDQPQFQLFSTPSMPQDQQLSWLLLGRPPSSGEGGGEQAMLANAALSLGLSGGNKLAQGLRGGLGLDEVSIGAAPGEDAEQAQFTVGKYLSPKLYVSYGVGIFQPGQVFRLLYELGRGFKVATESGVHTGGDLLYSIER